MIIIVIGTIMFIIFWSVIVLFLNQMQDARRGLDNATILAARAAATQVVITPYGSQRIDLTAAQNEAERVYRSTRPAIRESWGFSLFGRGNLDPIVAVSCAAIVDSSGVPVVMEDAIGCFGVHVEITDKFASPFSGGPGMFQGFNMRAQSDAALMSFEPS
jgi:hypothetical protein